MKQACRCLSLLAACLAFLSPVTAQNYPTKPVRVFSASPLGSSGDVALRIIAERLGAALGQPVIVELRPGATGAVAIAGLKSAEPDGHTILWTSASTLVTPRFLVRNLPYDSLKDFSNVSLLIETPSFLVVNAQVPAASTADLIEHARRNPAKLAYGSSGIGSGFHLIGESIAMATGVKLVHVPYNAANAATGHADLVAGRLQMFFPSMTSMKPYLTSGKLRVLAILSSRRFDSLPDVPTIYESIPNYANVPSWFGMVAPLKTPQNVVGRLNLELGRVLKVPATVARLGELGNSVVASSPEAMGAQIRSDIDAVSLVVKVLGIHPQ